MEREVKKEAVLQKTTNLDETLWRAHVETAVEYPGSNQEYCKSQGLNLRQFKKYKSRFGFALMQRMKMRQKKSWKRSNATRVS